jgi:hypothetical protein
MDVLGSINVFLSSSTDLVMIEQILWLIGNIIGNS